MVLTVVVLNYNTWELLTKCLKSIFSKKWQTKFQVIVVDNASEDDLSGPVKKKFPKVNFIRSSKNLGYSAGNNLALRRSKSDYTLLLNSDTELLEGALDNIVTFMEENEFGIGSCKLINIDGSLQSNAGDLPMFFSIFNWLSGLDDFLPFKEVIPSFHRKSRSYYQSDRQTGWVSGTAMIIKKETIKKIGLLDENIFMYAEDTEYCLRASRSRIKVGWCSSALVKHLGGGSSKDPSFNQWFGEFRGLLYIYGKYFGEFKKSLLKVLIIFFTGIRTLAFLIIGRRSSAKTYAKVLISL